MAASTFIFVFISNSYLSKAAILFVYSKTFQKSFLNLLHFPFACQPHEIVDTFFIYRENLFQQHDRWSAESGVFVNKNVRWLIRLFGNT
mgnify:FL=1